MWLPRFASNQNFLDPPSTRDGKPYGPYRYNEIVKECYYITKYTNTTYSDIMNITPIEREALLKFIQDDIKRQNDSLEKAMGKNKQ